MDNDMQEVGVDNQIEGIRVYVASVGLGATFVGMVDESISTKLNYIKHKKDIGYDENLLVPIVMDKSNDQLTVILDYAFNTPIRLIMNDIVLLGGKFANFSISDNTNNGSLPSKYTLTIYLDSSLNKHVF